MPTNINQRSDIDSYTHDNNNTSRSNGTARIMVTHDYNDDENYSSGNNNRQHKRNARSDGNNNNNDDDNYVVNNNRHMTRNTRFNDDNYSNSSNGNRRQNRNIRSNDLNDMDEDTRVVNNDRYTTRNINNSRYNNDGPPMSRNINNSRNNNDVNYNGPSVITGSNMNNGDYDDDYMPNRTTRRNSAVSQSSLNVPNPILALTQAPQPINYEQLMLERQQTYEQQRDNLQKKMDEHYPIEFIVIYSFVFILICITIIALQIAMIVFNVALATIGSGIWCGCYFLIAVGLALSTIFHRQYTLMHASLVMHFFGMFLAIGGLVIVNIVAITRFNLCDSLYFNQICTNRSLEGSHIAMIVFGCLCFLMCVIFFAYIQCTVFSNSPLRRNSDPYGYLGNPSIRRGSFQSSLRSNVY